MPMTEDELRRVVESLIDQAERFIEDEISHERATAMEFYLADPDSMPLPDIEGRSRIVTHDVADVIEWILPDLIKMFATGPRSVSYDPTGEEDEKTADQASDYAQHVFWKDNEGFLVLYQWFKDALIQKNGIVKIWWDDSEKKTRETLDAQSVAQLQQLEADDEVEIIEKTDTDETDPLDGQPLVDVTVIRRRTDGRIKIEAIPPEEFIVVPGAKLTEHPLLIGHRATKTVSELVAMGFDRKTIEDLATGPENEDEEEKLVRDEDQTEDPESIDPSLREVPIWETYALIDFDQDGIAETRQVTVAGNKREVLVNEEVDDHPFASITPIILSHRFFGRSVAETVMDLQLIKSATIRQLLDNMYVLNNQRTEVVESQVNLDDLLTSRAGGVVRVKTLGQSMAPIIQPALPQHAFSMLELIEQMRSDRTGVDRNSQGLNPDALNTSGIALDLLQSAARQRIELIGRVFAETGVKRLFKRILQLLVRHQPRERVIRLRGDWVKLDPRTWNASMDVTVTAGLGRGSKDRKVGGLSQLLNVQKELFEAGAIGRLVTEQNIFNTLSDLVEAGELGEPTRYFANPEQQGPPQQQQDPELIKAQAEFQFEQQKAQMEFQLKQAEFEFEKQLAVAKFQLQRAELMAEIGLKAEEIDIKGANGAGRIPIEGPADAL